MVAALFSFPVSVRAMSSARCLVFAGRNCSTSCSTWYLFLPSLFAVYMAVAMSAFPCVSALMQSFWKVSTQSFFTLSETAGG